MKKFKEMIQCAKEFGVGPGSLEIYSSLETKVTLEQFMSAAERCKSFVFSHTNAEERHLDRMPTPLRIDPPFECFSIEFADGGVLTCPHPDDFQSVSIETLIFEELEDGIQRLYLLTSREETTTKSILTIQGTNAELSGLMTLVQVFLDRLQVEKCGIEKVRERVSYRLPGQKKKKYISKNEIYVVAGRSDRKTFGSRDVNWTHAFDVRGHWRYLVNPDTFGVTRKGERTEKGRTWVKNHRRKEDLEFRQDKIRIVNG